jgi:hypothetical protein
MRVFWNNHDLHLARPRLRKKCPDALGTVGLFRQLMPTEDHQLYFRPTIARGWMIIGGSIEI